MSDQALHDTKGIGRILEGWVKGLCGIGTFWIFLLMLLVCTDIALRTLFNSPIDGVPEMIELSIAGIVFLQLGDAVRVGRLTRSDALYNRLTRTKPKLAAGLGVFFDLAGAAFFGAILVGAFPMFIEAYENNYYTGNEGIFTAPVWPIRLILVISCITVILVFLTKVWAHIKILKGESSAENIVIKEGESEAGIDSVKEGESEL